MLSSAAARVRRNVGVSGFLWKDQDTFIMSSTVHTLSIFPFLSRASGKIGNGVCGGGSFQLLSQKPE